MIKIRIRKNEEKEILEFLSLEQKTKNIRMAIKMCLHLQKYFNCENNEEVYFLLRQKLPIELPKKTDIKPKVIPPAENIEEQHNVAQRLLAGFK